jgi:hypothetical protein
MGYQSLTHSYFGEKLFFPLNPYPAYNYYRIDSKFVENSQQFVIDITITNFTIYVPESRYYLYTFKWYTIGYVETDGY